MTEIAWSDSLSLGRGVNPSTYKTFRRAINVENVVEPPHLGDGQDSFLNLELLENSRELASFLSLSASATFNGGSAEAKITRFREFNSYYLYALIIGVVANPPVLLDNPELTDEAQGILETGGLAAFYEQYGYEYIEGYSLGGSYYAIIEIQTRSETQKNTVKGKLGGFIGAFNGSLEFESSMEEIQREHAIRVYLTQSGGSGDSLEVSVSEMIEAAKNFPQLVKDNPVEVRALVNDYKSTVVLNNSGPPSAGIDGTFLRTRRIQRDVLNDLGNKYLELKDYKSNLEFILQNLPDFDEYAEFDDAKIKEKREEFQLELGKVIDKLNEITRKSQECVDNPNKCEFIPGLSGIIRTNLPKIEGDLMRFKQIEEILNGLRKDVDIIKDSDIKNLQKSVSDIQTGNFEKIEFKPRQSAKGTIRVADFLIGGNGDSGRRQEPGRALVDDYSNDLVVNYGGDWPKVSVRSPLEVQENLLVKGEIQGKLWYSEELYLNIVSYEWRERELLPASKCFPIIAAFDRVLDLRFEIKDGNWWLYAHGSSGAGGGPFENDELGFVKVRCVGLP